MTPEFKSFHHSMKSEWATIPSAKNTDGVDYLVRITWLHLWGMNRGAETGWFIVRKNGRIWSTHVWVASKGNLTFYYQEGLP